MSAGREPRRARVLVVDDAEEVVRLLVDQLEPDFRVWTARDGLEAWQTVLEEHPDVVVTDIAMPGRSGLWLLQQIRAHEATRQLPVVMLTGRGEESTRARAREEGADVYVPKPFRFRELKAALDSILERKREQVESLSHETASSMRMLTSGMAHELLNPTGFISNALYGLDEALASLAETGRRPDADELERMRALVRAGRLGVERIQALVADLRSMSGGRRRDFEAVDLNRALRSTLALVGVGAMPGIRLHQDLDEPARVLGDPGRLNQVLLNLLTNAVQALAAEGGDLWVRTRRSGGQVELTIADGGPGIPAADLDRVFDPFFTTKSSGAGMGLGLALCRQIVTEHGGQLGLTSVVGEGTTVSLRLPGAPSGDGGGDGPKQLELVSS